MAEFEFQKEEADKLEVQIEDASEEITMAENRLAGKYTRVHRDCCHWFQQI